MLPFFITPIHRSASNWSVGVINTERSIYKAYQYAIRNAQHFIYIENQYFIASIDGKDPKNKLAKSLYNRFVPTSVSLSLPHRLFVSRAGCMLRSATESNSKLLFCYLCTLLAPSHQRQLASLLNMFTEQSAEKVCTDSPMVDIGNNVVV